MEDAKSINRMPSDSATSTPVPDMDPWSVLSLTLLLCFAAAAVFRRPRRRGLPPGPRPLPFLGNLLFFLRRKTFIDDLVSEYGPVVTIHVGSRPTIIVADRDLAHEMLIQNGAIFADRPPRSPGFRLDGVLRFQINAVGYGPLWRLLRRNLATEMLNPSRVRLYAGARRWTLNILLGKLRQEAISGDGVVTPREAFVYAMFCLLVFLCFGERLDDATVRQIQSAQTDLFLFVPKLDVFNYAPAVAYYLFRGRRKRLIELRRRQREILLPLIRARRQRKESRISPDDSLAFSYVDSILELEIPEGGGRKPDDEEIIALCSEFLTAGTDTTSTALEWIMANIVRSAPIQEKLAEEVGAETEEEDLKSKPYLKAVVLEGLRRHPPGHFVLPHANTEEMTVGGYTIPKGSNLNFAVKKMNTDEGTWREATEFRPERFLPGGEAEGADITGSKKIEMMTFGAGRRICPGMGMALLHLEYFVANLVGQFRWEKADDGEVDLSEKPEFTVVMKSPLRARLSPR